MKHFLLTILLLASLALFATPQKALTSPWTGGLNACQFGRMDLDGDGRKDLLVFDRHGNRLLCFLNRGGSGEIDYQYTTDYDEAFPRLTDWVVFTDYDDDGLEDIFTYSRGWAGIKVYRNVSCLDTIRFELAVTPYLTSYQGGGEVNILSTEADYPAIVDLDGDGDLDILTFGVLGTFIEKHLNLSMERYGCRDSLVFERTDLCWGRVGESEEDNLMYLDTCLFGYGLVVDDDLLGVRQPSDSRGVRQSRDDFRHRGATVTVRDLTGDGLPDLLLADVDYPGITLLVNGGSPDNALMVNQMDFPPDDPVRLFSMPVPFFTDVDNDGVDDLLVSPFDPDPMASEGQGSVWLYLNHGTDARPDYRLYTRSFLQDRMLDHGTGAYPVLVDWDGDGLLDLAVGNVGDIDSTWYSYGSLVTHRTAGLSCYRNVGLASQPVFEAQPPLLPLLPIGAVPAFADLDQDGRMEILVGSAEGPLRLYDHDGSLLDDDFLHYGKPWSAPCFYDVDRDGVLDLVVGNVTGRLSFYHGAGALAMGGSMLEVACDDDFWGQVDVRDYSTSYYGFSVPTLFRWGGETLLAVGSESGRVFLFEGITAEAGVAFREVPERWQELCPDFPHDFGMRSAAALADLDNDGQLEILVGNFGGGLQLFNASIAVNNWGMSEELDDNTLVIFPNPVQSLIHIVSKEDDLQKVIVMDLYGRVWKEQVIRSREALLDVTDLSSGVYLLGVVVDRGRVNRTFLKR